MDVPRTGRCREENEKRIIIISAGRARIILGDHHAFAVETRRADVDRSTVWIDTVKRGPMVRQVRGLGTLVPEDIRWIPANTEGRVEKIIVWPGAQVEPDTLSGIDQSGTGAGRAATPSEGEGRGSRA